MNYQLSAKYDARCDQLLRRAKGGQWDSDYRLDWGKELSLHTVKVQPPLISTNLANNWTTLDDDAKSEAVRMMLGSLLGNLAVGEVFVDQSLTALKDLFPHPKLHEVLEWQIIDEVRHAEVLDRYVKKIGWDPRVTDAAASRLEAATEVARQRWDTASLLVMILEIAATAAIQGLRIYCDEPLTQALLKGVVQDESRHISGMTVAVRAYRDQLDEEAISRMKDTAVLGWLQALAVTETPACQMSDLLDTTFATAPLVPTQSWPFFRKTLSDILVPKLKLLGLMDEDLATRLRAVGCPVPALA